MNVTQTLGLRLFLYEDRDSAYFCIKHVDTEVTKRSLEEVILGTVFQQRAIHGVGSNLKNGKHDPDLGFYYYSPVRCPITRQKANNTTDG